MAADLRINRSLRRSDFPATIWAFRSDDHTWCWAVTIFAPRDDSLVPLFVPPLAKIEGVPIDVKVLTAGQQGLR